MDTKRIVKVFRSGRDQAVLIPRELELPGDDAIMRKEGDRLVIEPSPARPLLAVLAKLQALDEEFPTITDMAAEPVEL
jgi:antitoxin VapB